MKKLLNQYREEFETYIATTFFNLWFYRAKGGSNVFFNIIRKMLYIWILRGATMEGKNKKQPLHKIDTNTIYQKDGRKFKGEI